MGEPLTPELIRERLDRFYGRQSRPIPGTQTTIRYDTRPPVPHGQCECGQQFTLQGLRAHITFYERHKGKRQGRFGHGIFKILP